MPIALAEYSLRMLASVATDVFWFHSNKSGGSRGEDVKRRISRWHVRHWYGTRTSIRLKTGVHNQYLSRFDMRAWSPRLFNALQVFYFNMRLSN